MVPAYDIWPADELSSAEHPAVFPIEVKTRVLGRQQVDVPVVVRVEPDEVDQLVIGKVEANLAGDVYEPLVGLLLVDLLWVEPADVPSLLTVDEQIHKTVIVEVDPCCLPARAATLLDADLG